MPNDNALALVCETVDTRLTRRPAILKIDPADEQDGRSHAKHEVFSD